VSPKNRTLYDELCTICVKNDVCPRVEETKKILIDVAVNGIGLPEGISVYKFNCIYQHNEY